MFENIIGQPIIQRLISDIENESLAPSILFEGGMYSGKCTAALELARILSCENKNAAWNCSCVSCNHNRLLSSPDIMILGPANFSAQILAAADSFRRDKSKITTKIFFFREVKKLMLRFMPDLIKDDPKISKLNPLLDVLNKDLEELFYLAKKDDEKDGKIIAPDTLDKDAAKMEKLSAKLVDNLIKLESEGISDSIPVLQIRNASYWLHLRPSGKKKVLIIENADRMKDEARNSLLKILEEPPSTAQIIMTTENAASILPTLLSRLRQYSFVKRSKESDAEIIRRVFKGDMNTLTVSNLHAYLDNFLPVSEAKLLPAAAFFWMVISNKITQSENSPNTLTAISALNKYCIDLIKIDPDYCSIPNETIGGYNQQKTCALILKSAACFEQRNSFNIFLQLLFNILSSSLKKGNCISNGIALRERLQKSVEQARVAKGIYNQTVSLVLERLFLQLASGA
ncbi:hypothetical protein FACS1894102_1370 [Spirochaetia bacterium]|nr:hypothetical protein FACS1894102_1370 [Spirochaetia bacterium]